MSLRHLIVALALPIGISSAAYAQTGSTAAQPPACSCPGVQGQAGMGMGANAGANTGTMPMHGMCGRSQMQLGQMANVTVQDTPQGAIVRFDAKDPAQVSNIRGMAQRMSSCMNPETPPACPQPQPQTH